MLDARRTNGSMRAAALGLFAAGSRRGTVTLLGMIVLLVGLVLGLATRPLPTAVAAAVADESGSAAPVEPQGEEAAGGTPEAADETNTAEEQPDVIVVLETTKGEIEVGVYKDWAPLGAERFLELVNAGYYDGAPWFRVIGGFVAQCGIAADPAMNEAWSEKTFKDDPVVRGNQPGFIAFGKTGAPDSRSTHIFINYADNSRLDEMGFACFAKVEKGMDVALKLYQCEYDDQGGLAAPGGLESFKRVYPKADYILRAYVKE